MAMRATKVMAMATAAATDPIRMSRLPTWLISWARTPRSSSQERASRMPAVTATAAWSGLRPVAKALGWRSGVTYSFGIGRSASAVSSRTMRYSSGISASVTGCARAALMAMVSENQYEPPTTTRPRTRPMIRPPWPQNEPMNRKRPPRAASRVKVLSVFFMARGTTCERRRAFPRSVVVAAVDVDAGHALAVEHVDVAAVVLEGQAQVEAVAAELADRALLEGP